MLTRRDGRAPVWFEVLVAAWLLWIYDQINDLAPLRRLEALHNAANVLAFERSINLSPELSLDHWVVSHATLGLVFSYYYVSAHFFVTFGLLAYMWWKRPAIYRPMRTQLVLINVIGLVVFWRFPVAPPRMLISDGFRDIIALTHAVGDFHRRLLAKAATSTPQCPLSTSRGQRGASSLSGACSRIARPRARGPVPVHDRIRRARDRQPLPSRRLRRRSDDGAAVGLELAADRWIPAYRRRRFGLSHWRARIAPGRQLAQ